MLKDPSVAASKGEVQVIGIEYYLVPTRQKTTGLSERRNAADFLCQSNPPAGKFNLISRYSMHSIHGEIF
jgi:hypothetical protein